MGLFTKKDPCAICGGKVKGLFASKIDGQYICKECYGWVDLPGGATKKMSVADFKGYMTFREENDQLRQKFQITQKIDFGWFDTKFVFDAGNRLLCMDAALQTTVFEGKHVKSFIIKEDSTPLFEGSTAGLVRHSSAVPDRVADMYYRIRAFRDLVKMQAEQDDCERPRFDEPEPFDKFNVEIYFEHPYWDVFTADMSGPRFDETDPDADDYLRDYREHVSEMEQLARAIMQVAFPDAPVQTAAAGTVVDGSAAGLDAVAEIKRYKDLLEQGAITEEEFTVKKKQLLGI